MQHNLSAGSDASLNIRLSQSVKIKLQKYAKRKKQSLSQYVKGLIDKDIEKQEAPPVLSTNTLSSNSTSTSDKWLVVLLMIGIVIYGLYRFIRAVMAYRQKRAEQLLLTTTADGHYA